MKSGKIDKSKIKKSVIVTSSYIITLISRAEDSIVSSCVSRARARAIPGCRLVSVDDGRITRLNNVVSLTIWSIRGFGDSNTWIIVVNDCSVWGRRRWSCCSLSNRTKRLNVQLFGTDIVNYSSSKKCTRTSCVCNNERNQRGCRVHLDSVNSWLS